MRNRLVLNLFFSSAYCSEYLYFLMFGLYYQFFLSEHFAMIELLSQKCCFFLPLGQKCSAAGGGGLVRVKPYSIHKQQEKSNLLEMHVSLCRGFHTTQEPKGPLPLHPSVSYLHCCLNVWPILKAVLPGWWVNNQSWRTEQCPFLFLLLWGDDILECRISWKSSRF